MPDKAHIFEVAENDMDITITAVPEDDIEISGAQLDDYNKGVILYSHCYSKISMHCKFGELVLSRYWRDLNWIPSTIGKCAIL